ncbi:MAG: hypothetical protein EA423_10920 [Phycisphaerales bacterium]|nr:MAG: hypothetical protein EA423_10920 [Phycisphaerales bacterium]
MKYRISSCLLAAGVAVSAAQAQSVPASMYTDNTVMVAHVNLMQLNPQAIKSSVRAMIDRPALEAAGADVSFIPMLEQQLNQVDQMGMFMMMFTGAGANTVTMVMDMDPEALGEEPNVRVVMPVANEQAQQQMMQMVAMFGAGAGLMASAHQEDNQHFIVMYQPGQGNPLEGNGNASRRGAFSEAFGPMGDTSVLRFAMIPTEGLRKQAKENLDELEDPEQRKLVEALMRSEWFGGSLNIGNQPSINFTAKVDGESADQIIAAHTSAMDQMGEMLRQREGQLIEAGRLKADGVRPTDLANHLRAITRPTREGGMLRISLTHTELRDTTTLLIRASQENEEGFMELFQSLGEGFGVPRGF